MWSQNTISTFRKCGAKILYPPLGNVETNKIYPPFLKVETNKIYTKVVGLAPPFLKVDLIFIYKHFLGNSFDNFLFLFIFIVALAAHGLYNDFIYLV